MALQRTTEGKTGQHSYTREAAEPFAIRILRETFASYPPAAQARIRDSVRAQLLHEARKGEFSARTDKGKRQGSALARMAWDVYGVRIEE